MSHADIRSALRPEPDQSMVDIAEYVVNQRVDSDVARDTARYMLMDSLACAMLAMKFPGCVRHLAPAGGVLYWYPDPLARFQRYLAGRRVGTPIGQSGFYPGRGRLPQSQGRT